MKRGSRNARRRIDGCNSCGTGSTPPQTSAFTKKIQYCTVRKHITDVGEQTEKKEPSNRIKTTKADGRRRRDKFGDAINMSREWRQRIHFDRSAGDNPFVCFHLETCHPPPLDGPENCPALQLREAARRTIDMLIIAQTAAKNRATAKRTGSDGVLGFFFFFFSSK